MPTPNDRKTAFSRSLATTTSRIATANLQEYGFQHLALVLPLGAGWEQVLGDLFDLGCGHRGHSKTLQSIQQCRVLRFGFGLRLLLAAAQVITAGVKQDRFAIDAAVSSPHF